jgi:hypothetical protein
MTKSSETDLGIALGAGIVLTFVLLLLAFTSDVQSRPPTAVTSG